MLIGRLHACESRHSCAKRATHENYVAICRPFVCQDCGMAFASSKACSQHARRKHDKPSEVSIYLEADGKCPVCGKQFISRLRCMAHLADRRRGSACRRVLVSGAYPALPPERFAELQLADSQARKAARAAGHTQTLVPNSHRRASGALGNLCAAALRHLSFFL